MHEKHATSRNVRTNILNQFILLIKDTLEFCIHVYGCNNEKKNNEDKSDKYKIFISAIFSKHFEYRKQLFVLHYIFAYLYEIINIILFYSVAICKVYFTYIVSYIQQHEFVSLCIEQFVLCNCHLSRTNLVYSHTMIKFPLKT